MAITNTWSISNMKHTEADGGVILVFWDMISKSDCEMAYTAADGGKLHCEYDASSSSYVPYADLTEDTVLSWIYNSFIEDEETAEEAKTRIETNGAVKVQNQIEAAAITAFGVPW